MKLNTTTAISLTVALAFNVCLLTAAEPAATSGVEKKMSKTSQLEDVRKIRSRMIAALLERGVSTQKIRRHMVSMRDDGSWEAIDYNDQHAVHWRVLTHLNRLVDMSKAYVWSESELKGDAELKGKINAGYDYWMDKDFESINWFHNDISVPVAISRIMLLMGEELSEARQSAGYKILDRPVLEETDAHGSMTGANLIWAVKTWIARGVLREDVAEVARAFKLYGDEIVITDGHGIQADWSFHQHGKCLYSGGYGLSFVRECMSFLNLPAGTAFEFPPEKAALVAGCVLDGQGWMIRGRVFDYSAVGRSVAKKGTLRGTSLLRFCEPLAKLNPARSEEFSALANRIRAKDISGETALVGNKHFWKSDIMVHHRKKYYTSAKMFSSRISNTDWPCAYTGLKSHYVSDGTTYIYVDGLEYVDVFGVWNWRKIPGTTVEQSDEPLIEGYVWVKRGAKSFVGGVSDGLYGMAAYDFARDTLSIKKAWFYFDDEFVCLGADISCDSDNPVFTTVNQCLLKGDVQVSCDGEVSAQATGNRVLNNPSWNLHNRIGYAFPQPTDVTLKNEAMTGNWHEINGNYPADDEVSTDVFMLGIDHGKKPSDASYAYIVAPATTQEKLDVYGSDESPVEILSNTPDLQAAAHKQLGIVQATFYKAGKVAATQSCPAITVDKPCLVSFRRADDNKAILAVSNPENKPLEVLVTITGQKLNGPGCRYDEQSGASLISVKLPDGSQAGKSEVIELNTEP